MGTVKRVSSSYTINTFNSDPIIIDTRNAALQESDIFVYGNLIVSGATSQVNSTNLTVEDNVITLNKGETGAGVTSGQAGIEVDRGTSAAVALRWYEPFQKWQITTDGTTYANIATQLSGSYLTEVVEDTTPQLGGNLETNGFSITSVGPGENIILAPTNNVQINGPIQVQTVGTTPTTIGGYSLVYAANSTGGGTGVYTSSAEFINQELVSKKKAIAYALLF